MARVVKKEVSKVVKGVIEEVIGGVIAKVIGRVISRVKDSILIKWSFWIGLILNLHSGAVVWLDWILSI